MRTRNMYVLPLVVVLVLVGGAMLFGGGKGEKAVDSAEARLEFIGFHESGFPIVDETVTITVIIPRPGHVPTPYDEQTVIKELQEKTNVDIVFDEIPVAQIKEKVNLMFASREFPDVIMNGLVTDRNLYEAAQGGDVWELEDLIQKYAPNWAKAFAERPVIKNALTLPDGKIYSLPYYREIGNDYGIRDITAINVDWLEKVGKSMPTTTEEFYKVLKAFRNGIDSGTLPKEGIPWYFRFHQWVGGEFELYGPLGLWVKDATYLSINNGKVEFGATDPKLKDVVNYMHKLFKEDLFPEEVFTDDWNAYIAKTRSVPPISGVFGTYFIVTPIKEWYDALPPLAGPDGTRRYRSQPVRLQKNMFVMFTKFEYPEVMMRFIDMWADDEFSVLASYGGPMIQRNSDGTMTVVGRGTDWYNHGPHNQFPSYISGRASDKVRWTGEQGERDRFVRKVYMSSVWPQDRHYAYITYNEKELDELSMLESQIRDHVKISIANWIVNGGIEGEWDTYLNELNKLGLDKIMKVYQQATDRFFGK